MSNSKRKMRVTVGPTKYGKKWVKVELLNGSSFLPSFEDLHRIIQAIGYCEQEKYAGINAREKLAQFLVDSVWEDDFQKVAAMHKIPIRCGEEVVKTNGASVS